ncbi:hypothetical protein BY05_26175 [Escherichia coli O111:NM str. 2011C-3632]|nr:hypothetical protein BY05_26175 [Escherichia coli O111:NM str. 2011C-3632]
MITFRVWHFEDSTVQLMNLTRVQIFLLSITCPYLLKVDISLKAANHDTITEVKLIYFKYIKLLFIYFLRTFIN